MGIKKFFSEFKEFALKGNIMDMAVGVVVGGAFSKIVSSLVADIITPLISLATGKVLLTDLKWVIAPAVYDKAGNLVTGETALTYGVFLQSIIDFLIIAISIFAVLKMLMSFQKKIEELKKAKEAEAEEAAPAPEATEVELLKEIRDLMKKDAE